MRKVLVLAVLPLVAALVLTELYLRIASEPLDLLALTGRREAPNPSASWALTDAFSAYRARAGEYGPGHGRSKTVNSQGYISTPELSRDKPRGTVRLAFFGGSSTAGTSPVLPDEQTWPLLVVEQLREALPGISIDYVNAALAGYTSFESYGRLWSRVRFFHPDVLIVYHGWNDMRYFCSAAVAAEWRVPADGSSFSISAPQRIESYRPMLADRWLAWSQTYARLRILFAADYGEGVASGFKIAPCAAPLGIEDVRQSGALASDFDPAALEVWRDNLRLFEASAEALDAQLVVIKQATLIVEGLDPELQRYCRYDFHGFDHEAHLRAFDAEYRVIDEEIPADDVIDARSLSGKPELFVDHIHLTPQGARALARLVSDALRNRVRRLGAERS